MQTIKQSNPILYLTTVLIALTLTLTACVMERWQSVVPAAISTLTSPETTQPADTTAVPGNLPHITLETNPVASGFQTETVATATDDDSAPYWEVLPAYTLLTLLDYSTSSYIQPQIFIYPVDELSKANENAGKISNALRSLLQSPGDVEYLPFLPLLNEKQVIHTHLQYLNFKNGQGIRYLTQFSQGMLPINNKHLFYTYQGLSGDGRYYIAALLPVNHPSLPPDAEVTGDEPPEFTNDYLAYLDNMAKALDPQAANTFNPDLTQLDAMMSSLEIR